MPQCQFPVFCCFCVSEKLHRKYSRNWTKQKPNLLFFPKRHEVRRWDRGGPQARLTLGRRGLAPGRATRGETSWSTSWRPPSAYIFPSTGETYGTDRFSSKHSASRHRHRREIGRTEELFLAPCRRPSPPPWSPPELCVSSLRWTTGP
jgi:hypothetical protein